MLQTDGPTDGRMDRDQFIGSSSKAGVQKVRVVGKEVKQTDMYEESGLRDVKETEAVVQLQLYSKRDSGTGVFL